MDLLDKNTPAYKTILLLSWPTILEHILQTMVGFVDTAMVGSLGAISTAAISINTSTIWLINGLMRAFATGFCVLMAKNIGGRDYEKAEEFSRQCVIWTFIFGVALTVLMSIIGQYLAVWLNAEPEVATQAKLYMRWIAATYLGQFLLISCGSILRSAGDTKTPLILNMLNNLLNIVLNFFLIYSTRIAKVFGKDLRIWGAGMGVEGAALATGGAAIICAVTLLVACLTKDFPSRIRVNGSWKPDKKNLKSSMHISMAGFLEQGTLSSGQIALTAIISSIGTAALAAHYVANTAESITYLPTLGFATAATTLVAQSLGSGDKGLAKKFASISIIFGVATMAITGTFMFIFARELVMIFSTDPEVIRMGSLVLRIEAFAEPFFGLSMLVFGILRGSGDARGPFYISIAGMWIIRIPLAYVLVRVCGFGLEGAWIPMMLDLVVRGVICFFRFKRGKWLDAFDRSGL